MKEKLKRFDRRWWWVVLALVTALNVAGGNAAFSALFGIFCGLEIAKRFRRGRNELSFTLTDEEAERVRHQLLPWLSDDED